MNYQKDNRKLRDKFKHKQDEKYIRLLDRLEDKYYEASRNLGMVKLDEPYKCGYYRTFVLKESVSSTPEKKFWESLLKKINNRVFCRNKSFKCKDWKSKKKKDIILYSKTLCHHEWQQLDSKEQHYFIPLLNEYKRTEYVFQEERKLDVITRKHIVTHKHIIDPKLQSDLSKLQNKMYKLCAQAKLDHLYGRSANRWKDWDKNKMDRYDEMVKKETMQTFQDIIRGV